MFSSNLFTSLLVSFE